MQRDSDVVRFSRMEREFNEMKQREADAIKRYQRSEAALILEPLRETHEFNFDRELAHLITLPTEEAEQAHLEEVRR